MQQLKIAVVAANGKEGRLVVEAAVRRGHDVTAVVRGENKTDAQHAIVKDLFDLTAADLAGFELTPDGETLVYLARFEKGYDLWKHAPRSGKTELGRGL